MNLKKNFLLFSGTLLAVLAAGCTKEYASIEDQDAQAIQSHISKNNLTAQQYQSTGIWYQVVRPGTGAALNNTVKTPVIVSIRGINNAFSALDTFAAFNRSGDYLGYLKIRGTATTETLAKIVAASQVKAGGSIRMLIPSRALFGRNDSPVIPDYKTVVPGNTSLDVTLTFYDYANFTAYEDLSIQKYMAANSLTGFTRLPTGTYYKIIDAGSTTPISVTSTIKVEYTGKLFNGTVFDATSGSAFQFVLSTLIPAWQETVPKIQKGGTIQIIAPSPRCYGIGENADAAGVVKIPAFSALFFNIKVTDVVL